MQSTQVNENSGDGGGGKGLQIDIYISSDALLSIVITALFCICLMCCMCLIYYRQVKKIKQVEQDVTTPMADRINSLVDTTTTSNNFPANPIGNNDFHFGSSQQSSKKVAFGRGHPGIRHAYASSSPHVSVNHYSLSHNHNHHKHHHHHHNTNIQDMKQGEDLVLLRESEMTQKVLSTDLDAMDPKYVVAVENAKANTAMDQQPPSKLSSHSVEKFNKLNNTVVKLDAGEMFKRMTSKGTIVLHHRRATQRHFKAEESMGMNEIILPYDSKHGVRRFESVPGLRMTSIPHSEMTELARQNSVLSVASDKTVRQIQFVEGNDNDNDNDEKLSDRQNSKNKNKNKKTKKYINVTIIPGCQWIEKNVDKNKDEKSGKLILPNNFNNYELAIDYATKSKLGYYGVKFVLENDNTRIKLPFDSTIAEYQYSEDYLNKYILKNGTGIEMHAFPHFDRPLSDNSGFFIFGKKVNIDVSSNTFDLHLTAFKIPKKCFVFVPPFVIHSNDFFLGKWTTLLSWDQYINHVVIDDSNVENKPIKHNPFRWQFVESPHKTSPFYKQIVI